MQWINVFGLVFMTVIMIPNILFAVKHRDAFQNRHPNKALEAVEQIGRIGCCCFMIFNIPGTWFGWWSDEAFAVYLIADSLLVVLYCVIWVMFRNRPGVFRALALSMIPSVLFLFSAVMSRSVFLLIASVLFAPAHILISCRNAQ